MIQEIVFAGVVAMTLIGAFLAVWLKNVFYNALCLILCLFGVAALFIYLNSEFLAIMEIIIYIGAISIAIIFAIMLSHPHFRQNERRSASKMIRSLILAVLIFAGIERTLRLTVWPAASVEGDYSLKTLGRELLTTHVLPFETVSLVLLAAIIGALLISSKKEAR